jgi:hypothetical protein
MIITYCPTKNCRSRQMAYAQTVGMMYDKETKEWARMDEGATYKYSDTNLGVGMIKWTRCFTCGAYYKPGDLSCTEVWPGNTSAYGEAVTQFYIKGKGKGKDWANKGNIVTGLSMGVWPEGPHWGLGKHPDKLKEPDPCPHIWGEGGQPVEIGSKQSNRMIRLESDRWIRKFMLGEVNIELEGNKHMGVNIEIKRRAMMGALTFAEWVKVPWAFHKVLKDTQARSMRSL